MLNISCFLEKSRSFLKYIILPCGSRSWAVCFQTYDFLIDCRVHYPWQGNETPGNPETVNLKIEV